jgi:hypothetical protein
MLSLYAYSFVTLMRSLHVLENMMGNESGANPDARTPPPEPPNQISLSVGVAGSLAEELKLESARLQTNRIMKLMFVRARLSDTLNAITELETRIEEDLRARHFLFVSPELVPYWNKDDLFGPKVSQKFKDCSEDIRRAGSCLAVGEPTASVFHLMRAMEAAVRSLGKRLKVTITPSTTWRKITGEMDAKIKVMPDATDAEKRKKNAWEEARANLHHVGSVWRNNTMHPASSYTQSQALDVFNAVRVFMSGLAVL